MSKFTHFLKVGLAEAEHLLHEVHSPREIVLGFTEEVLHALGLDPKGMNTISAPPAGSAPVTPDTRDAELAAARAQVAALSAAVDAQIARLTAAANTPTPTTPPPTE